MNGAPWTLISGLHEPRTGVRLEEAKSSLRESQMPSLESRPSGILKATMARRMLYRVYPLIVASVLGYLVGLLAVRGL